jgi:2-oxoglutarate ferredoxin oxidoreductase subunit beta
MAEAISRPGFNLVEALTPCFTQYGRGNGFKSAVEMFKWLKSSCLPVERYEKLEDRTGKLPIGTFVRRDVDGLETRWANMRQALAAKKGGAA